MGLAIKLVIIFEEIENFSINKNSIFDKKESNNDYRYH
jgi:hypothetical protein